MAMEADVNTAVTLDAKVHTIMIGIAANAYVLVIAHNTTALIMTNAHVPANAGVQLTILTNASVSVTKSSLSITVLVLLYTIKITYPPYQLNPHKCQCVCNC